MKLRKTAAAARTEFGIHFNSRQSLMLAAALGSALALQAHAANLTFDTVAGDGTAITAASGTWDLVAGNTVWNNAGANVTWSQTSTTAASNTAIFGGADGTYAITVGAAVAANNLTFNNSGYTLSATSAQTLTLNATSPLITLAAGKSATIGSNLTVSTTSASGNPISIAGAGTLNIIGTGAKVQTGSNNISLTSGPIVNVGSGGSMISTAQFVIGTSTTTTQLNVDGGTVALSNTGTGNMVLANTGTGTVAASLTITSNGGTVTNTSPTGGLRFGPATGGSSTVSGTVNLNGGTLTVGKLYEAGPTVSTVNFDGGTLKALATTTFASTFMTGLDAVNVKAGGAKIDTNGIDITIGQAFLDATGGGGLTKLGSGKLTLTGVNTYTGTTDVQAGTLSIGASNVFGDTNTVQVSGGTLDVANAETVGSVIVAGGTISGAAALTGSSYDLRSGSISATLAGAASATKSTSGVVTLSGTQTYSGPTSVIGGTLNVTGTLSSAIDVAAGGTVGGEGSTTGNVVLGAGSSFAFDPTTSGPTDHFRSTGNIDTTAGASNKININVAANVSSGSDLVVFEGASITTNGLSDFKLGARGSLSLTPTQLLFTYGPGSVTWKGANATNPAYWDVNTTAQNFKLGASNDYYFDGDAVTFDDSASTFDVAIQGTHVSPGSVTVNNSANAYKITGVIAGNAALTKQGSNTLTLVGASTYTGGTTVNAGTLRLGDGTNAGSIVGAIVNNGAITVDAGSNDLTLANDITGSGSLTHAGMGTVTLTGANAYGDTVISAGTLRIGNGGAAGSLGTGAVTNNGTLKFERSDSPTVSNVISGSGGLIKAGAGVVTLVGSNSYDGPTTITDGGLIVAADGALGSAVGGTTIAANRTLGLSGGITYATAEAIIGSGTGSTVANTGPFVAIQRGLVQSVSGNSTFSGPITINAAGNTRLGTQNGASLTLTGPITMASGVTGVTVLFRTGLDGDWVTLTNSANAWDGSTTVFSNAVDANLGGGLRLGANNALPTAVSVVAGGTSTGSATTLDLHGFNQTVNGLTFSNGALHIRNLGAALSTLTLDLTADRNNTALAAIAITTVEDGPTPDLLTGANRIALVKKGTFTQTLVGANTYSGPTTIEAGTLTLARPAFAASGVTGINPLTTVSVASDARFVVATGQTHAIAGLSGAGAVVGGDPLTSTLSIDLATTDTNTFSGTIGGGGANENNLALVKTGRGTLVLANATSADQISIGIVGGLDLQGGKVVFDYTTGASPSAALIALLQTGAGSGFATGAIRSTTMISGESLGYNDLVSSNQFIIARTLLGDATLDGKVDFDDLLVLAQNYNGTDPKGWGQGDFSYDQLVNFDDLLALSQHYSQSLIGGATLTGNFAADWALAQSLVPEPTTAAAVLLVGGLLQRRRR